MNQSILWNAIGDQNRKDNYIDDIVDVGIKDPEMIDVQNKNLEVEIVPYDGMNGGFFPRIEKWVNRVIKRAEPLSRPIYLRIEVWKSIEDLRAFYRKEKEELGIVTSEESDFLATHEAWRGYPRIHVCHESVKGLQDELIEGVLHHEIGHALFHGSIEFYTFRFTQRLQEAAKLNGFDLQHLQQCVYFLSIAIKDWEVVQWLAGVGLGAGQKALLEYMIADTEEESEAWKLAEQKPVTKKIVLAAFLKVILPIEAMVSMGFQEGPGLKDEWHEAYKWLPVMERDGLVRLSQWIMKFGGLPFQEKLENSACGLIRGS